MKTIKIGLIGAGGNTRTRHIPGFKAIENIGRKKINKVKINYFLKKYDEDNISQQYLNLFKNI